jgi:hypothetical protein
MSLELPHVLGEEEMQNHPQFRTGNILLIALQSASHTADIKYLRTHLQVRQPSLSLASPSEQQVPLEDPV